MTGNLFRKEVLQAKQVSWLGDVVVASPIRFTVIAALAALVSIVVMLFLVFGTYARHSQVTGQLVPTQGISTVLAPAAGVLSSMRVLEGDTVRANQILAVIATPRTTLASGDTVAALQGSLKLRRENTEAMRVAEDEVLTARANGLAMQLDSARKELGQEMAEIETKHQQLKLSNELLAHLKLLSQQHFVSQLQVNQQEATSLEQLGDMQSLKRDAILTQRSIEQLDQSMQEIPASRIAQQAAMQRDLATLGQEQVEVEARGELTLTAPVAGIISSLLIKPGQAVQTGQPLLSILPGDSQLEAELFVPSRSIGFIRTGDKVLLRYQAYPYQKFGHYRGRIARISRSATDTTMPNAHVEGTESGESYYRVVVTLDQQTVRAYGKPAHLMPGMILDADILGERRYLYEWLFEPLYSFAGKLSDG